ncbi:MAG: cohesin domain-containing protein [Clostridiales bacterium]|nr:cohesin domain-containing protein [Clostridiales bacterium]
MQKKFTSFLILAVIFVNMFALSAFAEAAPSVTVGSATGKTGTTVEIPIVLSNNTGFSSLGLEIGYDETALTLTNVVASSSVGATFTKAQAFTVNPYNMSWDSASNTAFNGTLVTLTFEIIATVNGDYPVTVDYYKGRNGNYVDGNNVNYDENFEPLGLEYVSGKVTVTGNDDPVTESPSITVGNATGKKGDTVEIPVVLANNTGFSSLGIEIGYDETVLSLTNVVASSSTGATFTKAQDFTVNPYNMSWDSASNTNFNGILATLTFEIISNNAGTYPITVDYYKGRNGNYVDGNNVNYDENFEPLGLVYVGGKIEVSANDENSITLSEDLTVTLTGEIGTGTVYAAIYGENNRMKQVKLYSSLGTFNIEFDTPEVGDTVKVMWWKDNLQPMCAAKSITLR